MYVVLSPDESVSVTTPLPLELNDETVTVHIPSYVPLYPDACALPAMRNAGPDAPEVTSEHGVVPAPATSWVTVFVFHLVTYTVFGTVCVTVLVTVTVRIPGWCKT